MVRRLEPFDRGEPLEIRLEDRALRAYSGETVAAAILADGGKTLSRSLKYHRPRGAFCLDGNCSGCLMRIGGRPNIRACQTPCSDQLSVEGQNAYPSADLDVLGAVDWLFAGGMNHHTLMTGNRVLNAVTNRIVRQLSGLGQLPDSIADEIPAVREQSVDVLVVGGGPAGLAAAATLAAADLDVLVVDGQRDLGGSLRVDPRYGPKAATEMIAAADRAGATMLAEAAALAYYPEDGELVIVATPRGLLRVTARRTLYATGGMSVNLLVPNNDRPGVIALRAVGRLLCEHGIAAGERVVIIGEGEAPDAIAAALREAGVAVTTLPATAVRGFRGRPESPVVVTTDDRRIACDIAAVWTVPSPASELPRQHDCAVALSAAGGGFVVETNEAGRTSIADVFAAGDVCGYVGPHRAAAAGARVGAAVAVDLAKEAP